MEANVAWLIPSTLDETGQSPALTSPLPHRPSPDAATVDGVVLRKGDRVEWEGFGGVAWTGRGEIVGLFRDYDDENWPPPGVMLDVRFDRSEELDEWRRKIQETAGSGCFVGRGPYPFGDDVGDPLLFAADAVREAVRSGKLRVLGRAGDVAPRVNS